MCRIRTGPRRAINRVARKGRGTEEDDIHWDASPTEIDSHADTHCFGQNFRVLHWTGQECTVAPFLAEYSEQQNIQICTGATAYTMESGEVIILIFGQGLWFGNRMEKSLINPYQCRAHGIQLCDDPTDPHREMGIYGDAFVDLDMVGSTCGFISRYPTNEEMENCRHVLLSDEEIWDPSRTQFTVSTMKAEKYTNHISSRHISYIHGYSPTAPPVLQVQDDIGIHEYDRAMAEISTSLAQELMVDRIISKVGTVQRRNGYATITNDRHHGISAKLLAQK